MTTTSESGKPTVMYVTSTDLGHPDWFAKTGEEHGYNVIRCHTTEEALEKLAEVKEAGLLPVA